MFNKLQFISLTLTLFVALLGNTLGSDKPHNRFIFGEDDRVDIANFNFPFSTFVKIISQSNRGVGSCTGTLVWHNLVLTNAHCVYNNGEKALSTLVLVGYKRGKYMDGAVVTDIIAGTKYPGNMKNSTGDWAVLTLDKPLGSKYGYLEYRPLDWELNDYFNIDVHYIGYSGNYKKGEVGGVHFNCSLRNRNYDFLFHDCDTGHGGSGGPIWHEWEDHNKTKRYSIVGLNFGAFSMNGLDPNSEGVEYSPMNPNTAVRPKYFEYELYKKILEQPECFTYYGNDCSKPVETKYACTPYYYGGKIQNLVNKKYMGIRQFLSMDQCNEALNKVQHNLLCSRDYEGKYKLVDFKSGALFEQNSYEKFKDCLKAVGSSNSQVICAGNDFDGVSLFDIKTRKKLKDFDWNWDACLKESAKN